MPLFPKLCQNSKFFILFLPLFLLINCAKIDNFESNRIAIENDRFHCVRFDPSYYYETGMTVEALSRSLANKWKNSGINLVFIKAYDPVYGAVYRTDYPLNTETDYGRLDLLRHIIKSCHAAQIQVYAWVPAFLHKHAWEAHPEWRVKGRDGSDFRPSEESYHLCTRRLDMQSWWLGFIREILEKYPKLDGIDIAEPVVVWHEGAGCYCETCLSAYEKDNSGDNPQKQAIIRSQPLTEILIKTCQLIQQYGKSTCITTVATAQEDGQLLSSEDQMKMTGFDLDDILNTEYKPDLINVELIWQQKADTYQDTSTFNPGQWTGQATRQIRSQIRDRTESIIHVELTPFGNVLVSGPSFKESVISALDAGAGGIDFYDSFQADQRDAWNEVREVSEYLPLKQVIIFYDPEGINDARQIEVLLRHMNTETHLVPVDESFSPPAQIEPDILFYAGVSHRQNLPRNFIEYLTESNRTVCWLNHNLNLLSTDQLNQLGIEYQSLDDKLVCEISYKNQTFPKTDSTLNIIRVINPEVCQTIAMVEVKDSSIPYVVRSGSFWYFADLPTNFVIEGGRHIVFSDLLHDIVGEKHQSSHTALVRIEDVNPLSDPESLRGIADFLGSKKIPFAVGLTPFYLEPETNTSISMSDVPDFVKAIHYMISKGATIVLHGCTHQYRGQTTVDYEFWDSINDGPIFQDSEEYVIERINKALKACMDEKIYPLIWETPHYAASQIDYHVIERIFNTIYERKQCLDILGTDQLLPFFIPAKSGHSQMIPENLGYIPSSNPAAENLVQCAERNLAVRDGFASFFFHPFISLDVLKDLVKQIQDLGYTFGDVRQLRNCVNTSSAAILSGSNQFSIQLQDQYQEQIILSPEGGIKSHTISDSRLTDQISHSIECQPRCIYGTRALNERHSVLPVKIRDLLAGSPLKFNRLVQLPPLVPENTPVIPAVLINSAAIGDELMSQHALLSSLSSVGIDFTPIEVSGFLDLPAMTNLLIVPQACTTELTEQQKLFIIGAVSRGLSVILEKNSDLSLRIGITPRGDDKTVERVEDVYYPSVDILWKKEGHYRQFDVLGAFETYYTDKSSGDPLVIGGYYGDGRYLYLATLFDPVTAEGYGRFPFFIDLLQRQFGLWPLVRSESAEIYFEPGDREDVSIEDLVKLWKHCGFQKIYIAGWHIYPEWTYDYGRVIELAHQNGMLVYLWLELPHVNQKFWDEHPEWRERTATGREAIVDWRRLMALSDTSCQRAVFEEIKSLIRQFDWDGINLAELYFESGLGPEKPDIFTPMHQTVRNAFSKQSGFDPLLLFDPSSPHYWKKNKVDWQKFQDYRKKLVVDLHTIFLDYLYRICGNKDREMEIVVTVIDNIHAFKTGENTASDTRALLKLKEKFPFVLQIEDPQELWHLGPDRYRYLSATYQSMIPDDKLILDINIVPYREWNISQAPTRQPTGLELSQLMHSALQKGNRVSLYSESSIYEVDLPWISYTLASQSHEKFYSHQWRIQSPHQVVLNLDQKRHKNIKVNGQIWPAYFKGKAILPGDSLVIEPIRPIESLKNVFQSSTRIVDISGELKSCRLISRGVELKYTSLQTNFLVVNEKPARVIVDDELIKPEVNFGIPGYSLRLPAGMHHVKIFTATKSAYLLRNFSIVVSVLIVLISSFGGGLLLILYLTRSSRRRKNKKLKLAPAGE